MDTKIKKVLSHLKEKNNITSWEAIELFRATRLSAIIYSLKKQGHIIQTEIVNSKGTRFAKYNYIHTGE
tara:strand:+ start:192 stop:398 length:207 start_codon:yes stop_codon:yes gene_type:complete